MEEASYHPEVPRRRGILISLVPALFLLLAGFLLLPGEQPILWRTLLSSLLLLLGLAFFVLSFVILSTQYYLDREGLLVRWVFQHIQIPLQSIRAVDVVADFDTPLPLPPLHLGPVCYGRRAIKVLGKVFFAVTDLHSAVLVQSEAGSIVISPQDARGFVQNYRRLSAIASLETKQTPARDIVAFRKVVKEDKLIRLSLGLGLGLALLLWIVNIALMITVPKIFWVTQESVPSLRLILPSILGSVIYGINLLVGLYAWLRSSLSRGHLLLLWFCSPFSSLFLLLSSLLMAL